MLFNKKNLLLIFSFLFFSSALYPQQYKKLTIKGVRIYSEKELYSNLQLERFEEKKIPLAEVISLIENFYKSKNYSLVKVYATDVRAKGEYVLFVDEGRLGNIIVHNLNNYYSLKFKQFVDIPKRIYNTEVLNQNLSVLKSKFPGSEIKTELRKPPDYEGNIIQLDRELQRLKLGDILDIDFFERYIPVYDLHFFITEYKGNNLFSNKSSGVGYNINYSFPSVFIPQVFYNGENLFAKKDYLESSISAGIDPGLGGFFSFHPSNTLLFPPAIRFVEITGEYKASPLQNDFIGPLFRGKVYFSDTARTDLGITHYRYVNVRETIAPEITLLNYLNIYAGFGFEQVLIYRSKIDYESGKYLVPKDDFYKNSFAEARLKFDPIPIRIGNRIDKYFIITYTDYLQGNSVNRLEIMGAYDTEFENQSILSLRSKTILMFNKPPFFLNEDVNNQFFKGFSGKSYFTNKKLSASIEYRFSIYRDFLYAGGFFDWVIFEPEGYVLSGTKQGINYGPTGRMLIYDQFELIGYFGFDKLFPDKKSGTNLQIRLTKKW